MKKAFQLKSLVLSMAVAGAASMAVAPATTQAGVSANIGAVTQYVFRGGLENDSATASAGLDYESDSGFYLGTWVAEYGSDSEAGTAGMEYDLYGGWAGEFEGVSLGLGAAYYGYNYGDPFQEFNASLGYGMFTIGYDKGVAVKGASGDLKPSKSGDDLEYDHMYVSAEYESFGVTLGKFDGDTDDVDVKDSARTYLDVGYSTELSTLGVEGSVNYIYTTYDDSDNNPDAYLVFGVSKSFDIM